MSVWQNKFLEAGIFTMIMLSVGRTVATVLIVILIILVIASIVLYRYGKKLEAQQAQQQPIIDANTQTVSVLIVDKKMMKIKDAVAAGLPEEVSAQTPVFMKLAKLPVVKAKVGPRVMTLMADPTVFNQLPVKKECKVAISGLYIRELKSVRGGSVPEAPKKKGFFAGLRDRFTKK